MSDHIYGDKVGRDKNTQIGSNNTINSSGDMGASPDEISAAITELRAMITQLKREGAVENDDKVNDPAAVVSAVQSQPSRLRALATAIGAGAKDAVLSVVKGGVSELIVALVGAQSN